MSILTQTSSIPLAPAGEAVPEWLRRKATTTRRVMLNLAPLRYAFVAEKGGPIAQIEYGHDFYLGESWQLSRATLQPDLQHPMGNDLQLFHPADGTGVGKSRLEARAKAISEALERWAFYETSSGPDYMFYGYQHSMSTKGMAAFPGLRSRASRRLAVAEAFEYFTVDAWWSGALTHWAVERDDATIVFIDQPYFSGCVAIAIRHLNLCDYPVAYGIGSGDTPAEAETKAQLEASRLETILELRDRVPAHARNKPVLEQEQRILKYTSPEGYAIVKDRLSTAPWHPTPKPKIIFDGPIPGPWNKFTSVWRYVLEPYPVEHYFGRFAA